MDRDNSLSEYIDACQVAADKYIERSTRFGAADLKVLKALPEVRRFNVQVVHSLEVISETNDYKGVLKPDNGDYLTSDRASYQQQVQIQAKDELTRAQTLVDLVTTIKTKPYATISGKSFVRSHPRKLLHTYKCGVCQSAGKMRCHSCSGSGQLVCVGCTGNGKISCYHCSGAGSVKGQYQVRDSYGNYQWETRYNHCYHCSGSGRMNCSVCYGSGKYTCSGCSGSGQITCGTCAGHGYLTSITKTSIYTVPEFSGIYPQDSPKYVREAIRRVGLLNLEQYGILKIEDVDIVHAHARVDFTYGAAVQFCELSMEVAGYQSEWVLFGSPPRVHDAGGILEVLVKDDFARLDALVKGWARKFPWFHRRARRVVAPFMKSQIHQEMVSADLKGYATGVIIEKINNSLSEDYVKRSLNRLRQTVLLATRWSSLKWTMGIVLSSVPIIVTAIAFMEKTKAHAMQSTQDHLVLFPWPSEPNPLLTIAATTIPVTIFGLIIAKWVSTRWIRRSGGKLLVDWASRKKFLIGRRTAAMTIVSSAAVATYFFSMLPMWIDREGRLYGTIDICQPPTIIQPRHLMTQHNAKKAPERADMIRPKEKVVGGASHKAEEKAFDAAGFRLPASDPSNIQVGIYRNMIINTDNNTVIHTIPSKRWFEINGYNVNNAMAIRIPKSLDSNFSANEDTSKPANIAVINDLKNLRDVFLKAGADYTQLRQKMIEIVNVSNTAYARH